ncbi:MAG: manganese efflux pump [Clostridiales bacterium]|nr:manganese efflux pump [Clostridiales bacterium]
MTYWELILVSVGLAMDAFAAAICKGACIRRGAFHVNLRIAASFGIFQAVMPLIGYFLGRQFSGYIADYDHWVAFGLLVLIGGKMIWDVLRGSTDKQEGGVPVIFGELMLLSLATSIDALVVGVALAFLNANIFVSVAFIGLITFGISLAGTAIGCRFGTRYEDRAQIIGGSVLILLGLKILLEHMGVF